MGKNKNAKNASDSVDAFLTLMRNLEIVKMNRVDFCKREMVKVEEKLYQHRLELLKLSSNCSSLLSLITQKSDMALATLEQEVSNMNLKIVGCIEEDLFQNQFKKIQKLFDDVKNLVYTAPLITSSSNPSRDLFRSYFRQFLLLEYSIYSLGEFYCEVDSSLRKLSMCVSSLMKSSLEVRALINPPSADHDKNDAADS